jgi:LysM repeat protein
MLIPGNGRHRKPRQAPTAVVTVAATGAGMALPLLAASGAHAADKDTWTAVANCESRGQWSANTGLFFGGLQITQRTWDEYGGRAYAERPDLASISQQMEVANKILAAIGPDAWPGCAAGLTKDGSSASPSAPGPVLGSLLGSGSGAKESTNEHPGGGSGSASPVPSTSSPAPSGSSSGGGSATSPRSQDKPPSGTSPEQPPGGAPGGSLNGVEPEAESAWGVLKRDELPQRAHTFTDESAEAVRYRVRAGDTLCSIATEKGVSWRALYQENKAEIGNDPRLIHPSQYLTVTG